MQEATLYFSAGEQMSSLVIAARRAFFNSLHYGRPICKESLIKIPTDATDKHSAEPTAAHQQKQIEALTAGLQKVRAQLEASKPAP